MCFCRSLDWCSQVNCLYVQSEVKVGCSNPTLTLHLIPNGRYFFSIYLAKTTFLSDMCMQVKAAPIASPDLSFLQKTWISCILSRNRSIICFFRGKMIWNLILLCPIKCLPRNFSLQEVRSSVLSGLPHKFPFYVLPFLILHFLFNFCFIFISVVAVYVHAFCLIYYFVIITYSVTALPSGPHMYSHEMPLNRAAMMQHQFVWCKAAVTPERHDVVT